MSELVLEPEFGLLRQSWAPRNQARGVVNADGWGVGLVRPDHREPVRWRSARPLWGDVSFASVAPVLRAPAVIAAVRSATVGMPIEESASAPFTDGRWLLSHNGRVDRAVLGARADAESSCDAAQLAARVFAEGAERLGETVLAVGAADPGAVLNLLAIDGDRILGTTWGDTLCYREEPDGVLVASERSDDGPGWVDVPDRHLIEVTRTGVTVSRLEQR